MKPSYRPTYSLLDVLSASPSQPMPVTSREYQLALMHAALDAITRGEQPTKDDWRVLCDAVNMVDTLVAKGVAEDKDGLLQDATMALATAAKRSLSGAPIRLNATGITAVRGVLEDYESILEVLSHRAMLSCHRETEKRIWEIQQGRSQAHDVEVMKL